MGFVSTVKNQLFVSTLGNLPKKKAVCVKDVNQELGKLTVTYFEVDDIAYLVKYHGNVYALNEREDTAILITWEERHFEIEGGKA